MWFVKKPFQYQSSHKKLKQSHEKEKKEEKEEEKEEEEEEEEQQQQQLRSTKRPSTVVLVQTCRSSENCISRLVISPTRSKMERTVLDVEGPSHVDLLNNKRIWEDVTGIQHQRTEVDAQLTRKPDFGQWLALAWWPLSPNFLLPNLIL